MEPFIIGGLLLIAGKAYDWITKEDQRTICYVIERVEVCDTVPESEVDQAIERALKHVKESQGKIAISQIRQERISLQQRPVE